MKLQEDKTLIDLLDNSKEKFGDRIALSIVGGKPVTYSRLHSESAKLAAYLQNIGIEKGDKIILLAENSPEWVITYFAIERTGAIAVPILPEFHEKEIENIIKHSESKYIFASIKLRDKFNLTDFSDIKKHFLIEELPIGSYVFDETTASDTTKDIVNFFENNQSKNFLFPKIEATELASIIYTSGTTGSSKGVMLSHRNLFTNCQMNATIQDVNETDRFVSILPLSHTLEFTVGCMLPLMQGSAIYYLGKPPVAVNLLPALLKIRPTIMLTVPLIIEKIYKLKVLPQFKSSPVLRTAYKFPLTRKLLNKMAIKKLKKTFGGKLKFFGIGGAKLSFEVERFLKEGGFPYAIGYGLTETAPLIAGAVPENTRLQSTGFIVPQMQAKIDEPDSVTGEGEIVVKGANVMLGYYKNEKATKEVFTEDGWFRTGDLGIFDKDNFLFIRGRLKNMIVGPSGENIYPEDIEAHINDMDVVLESIVYELKGKLVARIHLNQEAMEAKYEELKEKAQNTQNTINEILKEVQNNVNRKVNKFSRLNLVIEQTIPFERTPTRKIKRYLYTKLLSGDKI